MNSKTLPLLALLLGLSSAGCAPDRMSLEAYGICSMPTTCTFSGKCDAYSLGAIGYRPAADAAVPDGLEWLSLAVELRNQQKNNADSSVGRVNSNDAHVTSVRLEIDGPVSGTISLDVSNQAVPAQGTAVVWTYVLPPADIQALASGTYTVNVFYLGYYDNGREFETGAFPIAVEVDAVTPTVYSCGTDSVTCGNDQQTLRACG